MRLELAVGLAAVTLLLVPVGTIQAEETRKWVDPPTEMNDQTVTYPDFPKPAAEKERPSATTAAETREVQEPKATGSVAASEAKVDDEPKQRTAKTAVSRKSRAKAPSRRSRQTVHRSKARDASGRSDRTRSAEVQRNQDHRPGSRKFRSAREALEAGFAVTRIRTYYLPDGRRVEVVTELDPFRPGRPY
jgi:hypothetical protein